jgi:predicted DNA-binding ribbon-helix-helix protein
VTLSVSPGGNTSGGFSCPELASERGMTLAAMIGAIDGGRKHANLSSAIRLFVLGVYRDQIASWGRH